MLNGFLKRFPHTLYTEGMMKQIEAEADMLLEKPSYSLPLSLFLEFERNGRREKYEQLYMENRRRLLVFLAMALWSEDKKWIQATEDAIWAVCDQYTWETPGHFSLPVRFEDGRTLIGLFAAETALSLCEAMYLLDDRLSDLVKARIAHEVRERVVEPFCEKNIEWGADNWSAVCGGSCGMAAMYLGNEAEAETAIKKSLSYMETFLSSYLNDGACLEGPLYWEFGFGFFCMFASMVREYSNGKIDLFDDEKVKRIARFGENIYLEDNKVIPFSDSPHEHSFHPWLFGFLAKEYNICVPPMEYAVKFGDDKRCRIPFFLRDMFTENPSDTGENVKNGLTVYSESQWYIKRNRKYLFAAKGGNNGEPHNHNDVGSFVLMTDGKYILDDLGWCTYDRDYFLEKRYDYICASSLGHSVPITDGEGQLSGGDRAALLLNCNESEFSLDLSGVYEKAESFIRCYTVKEEALEIKDRFSGEMSSICERFVTTYKPRVKEGIVYIEGVKIEAKCDKSIKPKISSASYTPRINIGCEEVQSRPIYFIDYMIKSAEDNFEIEIIITPPN